MGLAAAEVGSYRGGSACFIASALKAFVGGELPVHVFDTFQGHPQLTSEYDTVHVPGMFGDTDYEEVREYLAPFLQLENHKGVFPESARSIDNTTFSLVHVDVDAYRSTLDCLQYFGPRLAAGGYIVVDDFASSKCPGVRQAVVEHIQRDDGYQLGRLQTEQLVMYKK